MNMNYESSEMINEDDVRLFKIPTTVFLFVFTVLNGHMIKRNYTDVHLTCTRFLRAVIYLEMEREIESSHRD